MRLVFERPYSAFFACAVAFGCAGPTRSSPAPLHEATPIASSPAAASASPTAWAGGVRLTYGFDPPSDRGVESALAAARDRIAHIDVLKGIELRRNGSEILVEIPGTDEATFTLAKKVIRGSTLAIVSIDDRSDPLKASRVPPPPGVHLESERFGNGQSAIETHFAWTEETPSASEARARLDAYLRAATQGRGSFARGPYSSAAGGSKAIRSYAVAPDQLVLDVVEAKGVDPPAVLVTLAPDSASAFGALTGASIGKRLGMMLDDDIMSAPLVLNRIDGGRLQITMGSSEQRDAKAEAEELALTLRGLPAWTEARAPPRRHDRAARRWAVRGGHALRGKPSRGRGKAPGCRAPWPIALTPRSRRRSRDKSAAYGPASWSADRQSPASGTMPSVTKRSAIRRMSRAIQLGMNPRRLCSNAAVSSPG